MRRRRRRRRRWVFSRFLPKLGEKEFPGGEAEKKEEGDLHSYKY